jgi:acyl-CoA hydrolase
LYVGDKEKAKALFDIAHTIYRDQLVRASVRLLCMESGRYDINIVSLFICM